MNQRREPRFQTDQSVQLTIFGDPDIQVPATVRNVSGRGLGLEVPHRVEVGSALKVVVDDAILLGEVIYCRPQGNTWYTGIELEQALCGLAELAVALRSFSEEYLGPEQPHTVEHARDQHQKQSRQ